MMRCASANAASKAAVCPGFTSSTACSRIIAPCLLALYPPAGVVEHPHPRRVLAGVVRGPGHLHVAEHALRVRHEDREAPVGGGEAGDALRRAARVVWIALGRLARVVHIAHAGERRL